MKKVFIAAMLAVVTLSFTSCGMVGSMMGAEPGMVGMVYTGHTEPVTATSNKVGTKIGTSKSMSILSIAAFGDGGINKAAKMAGITKISHVDVKKISFLGLFTTHKYFVYGE